MSAYTNTIVQQRFEKSQYRDNIHKVPIYFMIGTNVYIVNMTMFRGVAQSTDSQTLNLVSSSH